MGAKVGFNRKSILASWSQAVTSSHSVHSNVTTVRLTWYTALSRNNLLQHLSNTNNITVCCAIPTLNSTNQNEGKRADNERFYQTHICANFDTDGLAWYNQAPDIIAGLLEVGAEIFFGKIRSNMHAGRENMPQHQNTRRILAESEPNPVQSDTTLASQGNVFIQFMLFALCRAGWRLARKKNHIIFVIYTPLFMVTPFCAKQFACLLENSKSTWTNRWNLSSSADVVAEQQQLARAFLTRLVDHLFTFQFVVLNGNCCFHGGNESILIERKTALAYCTFH